MKQINLPYIAKAWSSLIFNTIPLRWYHHPHPTAETSLWRCIPNILSTLLTSWHAFRQPWDPLGARNCWDNLLSLAKSWDFGVAYTFMVIYLWQLMRPDPWIVRLERGSQVKGLTLWSICKPIQHVISADMKQNTSHVERGQCRKRA